MLLPLILCMHMGVGLAIAALVIPYASISCGKFEGLTPEFKARALRAVIFFLAIALAATDLRKHLSVSFQNRYVDIAKRIWGPLTPN